MSLILPMLLMLQVPSTPTTTVAVGLSGLSLFSVGALLFKAGEWRGEHRALAKTVSDGYSALQKQIDDSFDELRQDIRDLRESK